MTDLATTTAESNPYGAASAGALSDLQAPPAATPPVEPQTPAPAAEPGAQAAADPKTAAPTDPNDILELKVKDRIEKLSLSTEREKLIELAQKGLDYTQKTQQAAEDRRQIDAYAQALQAREQQIAAFLNDPVRVAQHAQALLAQAGQAAVAADPNAVVTTQDLNATLQAQLQEVRNEMTKTVAAAQFQAEVARHESDYVGQISQTVKAAVEKFPILDSFGDPEELTEILKGDLAKKGLQPATIEEAKEAFLDLAKARAERLHGKVNDYAKMEAVRAAKMAKTGTEPPGGGAPAPAPSHFKLGDPRLTAAAITDMEAGRR